MAAKRHFRAVQNGVAIFVVMIVISRLLYIAIEDDFFTSTSPAEIANYPSAELQKESQAQQVRPTGPPLGFGPSDVFELSDASEHIDEVEDMRKESEQVKRFPTVF